MKNTDVISKYLEAFRSGQTEEQAELFARSWAESMEIHPEAATKSDLKALEMATKADIKELKNEMMAHFRIIYIFGTAIFTVSCLPIIQAFLKK